MPLWGGAPGSPLRVGSPGGGGVSGAGVVVVVVVVVVLDGAFSSPPPPQPTANDSAAALPNTAIAILRCDFIEPHTLSSLYPPVPHMARVRNSRHTALHLTSDDVCRCALVTPSHAAEPATRQPG